MRFLLFSLFFLALPLGQTDSHVEAKRCGFKCEHHPHLKKKKKSSVFHRELFQMAIDVVNITACQTSKKHNIDRVLTLKMAFNNNSI